LNVSTWPLEDHHNPSLPTSLATATLLTPVDRENERPVICGEPPLCSTGDESRFTTRSCRQRSSEPVIEIDSSRHSSSGNDAPALWQTAGAEHELTADPALLPTPAFEFDQRLTW
jgi:hypothetical protein